MNSIYFLLIYLCFCIPSGIHTDSTSSKVNNEFTKSDSIVTITITAVGDLMCHSPQYKYAEVKKDSFDFRTFYKYVKPFLENSDLTIGNLETVIAAKGYKYSGYPMFNTPAAYLKALKFAGFNLITTANNHALDKGIKGVASTIGYLKKDSINYEGTFLSQSDRDSIRIYDLKGIKVAVLAYTYGLNNNILRKSNGYLINVIDTVLIRKDIYTAREKGAEIVLVYYHFGDQYKRYTSKYQKEIVAKTIAFGADLILGGHPHVIEPARYFKTQRAKLDTGYVIYSLGNFFSNQMWRYADAGVILKVYISKDFNKDSLYISNVSYIPTWVFKGKTDTGNKYYILPDDTAQSDTIYKFLSVQDKIKMHQAFDDTKKMLSTKQ